MKETNYKGLTYAQKDLLDAAKEAKENSYNPYSHFYVGAAVRTTDKKIIKGTNHENASYGLVNCAERNAIQNANIQGYRNIEAIAIVARGETFETTEVTGPCGACRQVIYESAEVAGTDLEVIMSTTKGDKIIIATIEELLPLAFGPVKLGIDVKKYQ